MTQRARLITPRGKRIDLSPKVYRQIRRLITHSARPRSHARVTRAIANTYGKYAGGRSLTQALLAERAVERAREEKETGTLPCLKRFQPTFSIVSHCLLS